MQSSDPSTRVVPALPTDKGFWGQTKRVLIGDGVEIGRLCPRCGEFSAFKRTKFLETHGVHADGTPKCTSLELQQPPPESAAAAATAAGRAEPVAAATAAAAAARLQGGPAAAAGPAAGGNAGEADHEGLEWPGSDAMQLEFEASAEPQPELGDIWHDSAEDADWLEGLCSEDGEGAAAPYAGASDDAAAAAFADASSIFHSLYPDGHLTDEARTALAQQMGETLLQALESGHQPGELPQGANSAAGSREAALNALSELLGGDPGAVAALLGEGGSPTQEQLQLVNALLEQQHDRRAAAQDGGEEGAVYEEAAEGLEYDQADEGMAYECADMESEGSRGSRRHFEQLLTSPLWQCQQETAQLQLYQAIFLLMAWKMDYVVRDAAFIALLGILCHCLLPKAHNLPPSLYMFKQLLKVKDISQIEHHSCELGCTGWGVTPKHDWHNCKDHVCSKCGGKRFKTVMGRLVPVRRFWFIPLDDSIKELMSDPAFVKALQSPKVVRVGSFAASPEFKRLNMAVGGVLDSPEHGVLELGFDFAEPYIFAKHSTGLMFMRYASLPNGASAKREWHKLVMAIEGPTEPTVMDAFLEPLVDTLMRLAPPQPVPQQARPHMQHTTPHSGTAGVTVQPALDELDAHGKRKTGDAFTHYAVLGGVYADSPARAKLMYTLSSWTAYLACCFCKLVGTMTNGVVRYLGYAAPVTTTHGVGEGEAFQMGQPDGRLLTEREMKAQAIAAEYYRARGFEPPPGNRFKGHSPLLRRLYYVNPQRLWVIPYCHAFYLGVFKDFMKLVCAKKSKRDEAADGVANPLRMPDAERRVVRGRLGGLQLHPSFNRKFRDPFSNMASWQIDDCARAVQCFLPMLLRPARSGQRELPLLQPPAAKKAFGHLKRFSAFQLGHVQYETAAEYRAAARAAVQELIDYGALMEKELPGASACTFNLHLLTCQLYLQCVERGITHELFELWVERLIGEFKQRVKYRTRSEPEKTMVGDDLVRRALQGWRLQYPDVFTWQERSGQATLRAGASSSSSAAGEVLGAALKVTADTWGEALQQRLRRTLQHNIADVELRQLWLDNWQQLGVGVYREALLPGGDYVTSTAFTRARSRDGSFVMVPFTGPHNDGVKSYAARVRNYVQLTLPPAVQLQQEEQPPVLLFAVCDVLPYLQPYDDVDICGYDSIILFGRDKGSRAATFADLDYPVLLSNVECPLFRQEYMGQDGCTWWAFVPVQFKTGGKRH